MARRSKIANFEETLKELESQYQMGRSNDNKISEEIKRIQNQQNLKEKARGVSLRSKVQYYEKGEKVMKHAKTWLFSLFNLYHKSRFY